MIGCCAHHAHAEEAATHAAHELGDAIACSHESPNVLSCCPCAGDTHSGQSNSCGEWACVSVKPTNDFRLEYSIADLQISLPFAEDDAFHARSEQPASVAISLAPPLGLYLLHHSILI
jgi:hypothetical protein